MHDQYFYTVHVRMLQWCNHAYNVMENFYGFLVDNGHWSIHTQCMCRMEFAN